MSHFMRCESSDGLPCRGVRDRGRGDDGMIFSVCTWSALWGKLPVAWSSVSSTLLTPVYKSHQVVCVCKMNHTCSSWHSPYSWMLGGRDAVLLLECPWQILPRSISIWSHSVQQVLVHMHTDTRTTVLEHFNYNYNCSRTPSPHPNYQCSRA